MRVQSATLLHLYFSLSKFHKLRNLLWEAMLALRRTWRGPAKRFAMQARFPTLNKKITQPLSTKERLTPDKPQTAEMGLESIRPTASGIKRLIPDWRERKRPELLGKGGL